MSKILLVSIFAALCLTCLMTQGGASSFSGNFSPGTGAEVRESTNYLLADTIGQFVVGESAAPDNSYSCGRIEHGFWHSEVHLSSILDIKSQPDFASVEVYAKLVTAGTDQLYRTFYIEEDNRINGIRVNTGGNTIVVSEGDMVDVSGIIKSAAGERYIDYPQVIVRFNNVRSLSAFLAANRSLGGEGTDMWLDNGVGANNVSMLMQSTGRVTYIDSAIPCKFFYIDDGSGLSDGLVIGGQTMKGIRVSITNLATGNTIAPPETGDYVSVTGICAPRSVSGKVLVQLRPRTQADIVPWQ